MTEEKSIIKLQSKKKFPSWYLPEPLLLFGDGKTHVDPKMGLTLYGPLRTEGSLFTNPLSIKVGIIGTGETIGMANNWIRSLMKKIPSSNADPFQYPSFPGFKETFNCALITSENFNENISNRDIDRILDQPTFEDAVELGVQLFLERIESISEVVPKPDLVLCALPKTVVEYCVVRRTSTGSIKKKKTESQKELLDKLRKYATDKQTFLDNFEDEATRLIEEDEEPPTTNFWRALKAGAMKFGMPTQIVWPTTLQTAEDLPTVSKIRQDDASTAWNVGVALYYKGSGFPWTMTKMKKGTCYVGISFFKDLSSGENKMRTSLAQIFTYTGEGLVLRGDRFEWDTEQGKSPHLTQNGAENLLNQAIDLYTSRMKEPPTRVVVHKTSRYWEDEKKGFKNALKNTNVYDLVAMGQRGIRFFRYGNFPPLRGTVIQLSKGNYLLYTRGYTPFLRTYPGARVPLPLEILEHDGESSPEIILAEILALSKMNWNSAEFSLAQPITTLFSEKVGEVMASLPENAILRHEYLYYM